MKMKGRNFKRQKAKRDDIISQLPDVLLHHILTLLPMRDAVRTSILSRRWEYLWTSIPNLKFTVFDEVGYRKKRANFMNFVDRAIFLSESSVKQFSIRCDRAINELRIRGWITAMVMRNVEKIKIYCFDDYYPREEVLPYCLFTCASITKLSLFMYCEIKFPPSIYLSSLKHLVLNGIYFTEPKSINNFILGCPMLETMRLLVCSWINMKKSLSLLCGPKLWKLEITEDPMQFYPCHNIRIIGPSLKCFHTQGYFKNGYCLDDVVASLDDGKLDVDDFRDVEWVDSLPRLYKLLKGFSLVKKLSLSPGAIVVPNDQTDLLPYLPVFNNLSTLSFVAIHAGTLPVYLDWEPLSMILQNSPCLETLRFETGVIIATDCKTDKGVLEPVPPCFLSCLKKVEIVFYKLYQYRKRFVGAAKILLKRAVVLEKLIVYLSKEFAPKDESPMHREKLMKELVNLPRASKVCRVEFAECGLNSIYYIVGAFLNQVW